METVFLKLLGMSVSASWLILAVIATRLLLRDAPKSVRCMLWALVAVRLICPVSIPSPVSLAPQAPAVEQILTAREITLPRQIPTFRNQDGSTSDNVESTDVTPQPESPSASLRLTEILSAVWLAGLSAMLLYALAGFLRLRRTVSASLPTGGNFWICDDIPAPFILGILRPRVYLPSSVDETQARYVIAHENAHLRHYDHFWKPFGYALLSVYWHHPLVWLAYILFCRDLELACDERVVREMELSERAAYSQALLDCSWERGNVAACPLAFGETGVKTRVKAVLNYRKPAFWLIAVSVILCAVLAVCFLTSPSAVRNPADGSGTQSDVVEWVNFLDGFQFGDIDWNSVKELELPEFPGVVFRWMPERVSVIDAEGEAVLFDGMPVWNVFLTDLTGDGLPEFCATVSMGSGIIDERIEIYNYAEGILCEIQSRMVYDYVLSVENGILTVMRRAYGESANNAVIDSGPLIMREAGYLEARDWDSDGNLVATGGVVRVGKPERIRSEQEGKSSVTADGVSINPKDYGITASMLAMESNVNFSGLSLEALGAFYLHTDGAGAEGSGEELYKRFMYNPDTVLHYIASLGNVKARGENTAAEELCREIASANVFWYGGTADFSEILREYSTLYPDGPIAAVLEVLKMEYGTAVERDQARFLSPDGLAVSDNGNDGAARLLAEMPVPGGKLKQVELRTHYDFRGYDTVHELLMAPAGKDLGIDSGYLLYRGNFPPENIVYDSETKTVAFQAEGKSFVYDARSWI